MTTQPIPRGFEFADLIVRKPRKAVQVTAWLGVDILRMQRLVRWMRAIEQHDRGPVLARIAKLRLADGRTVEEARTELVSKVGENIGVRRIATLASDEVLASYTHGSRIGVAVAMRGGDEALARDLAMHIAASNPLCIDETGVPAETLDGERRILTEQAKGSGKPDDIVEKMVAGRLGKFLKEITLLGQPFVKDPDTSVGKLLDRAGATVTGFVRFEVGEGIEKR